MKHKQSVDKLRDGVMSLIKQNRYMFTKEDKALLEQIIVKLDEISDREKDDNDPNQLISILSQLVKIFKFLGIDNIADLF